ncbi:spore cortex biosynthesis protein YabQ [Virgibacillus sp. W0430]|uniref:spore cortex biosynthesis protein YabQ n=1 Tax=Virgibacillus sp. W0430 TaxID=3391580 RepID=UPI003F4616C4
MTLDVQFLTMLAMTIGGIYLGFALDTFRRLTAALAKKTVFYYVLEVSFWFLQTVLLFYLLFQVNGGELRFYVFLACLFGYSIYQVMFSAIFKKALEHILLIVETLFRWIKALVNRLLIQPIRWLVRILFIVMLALVQGFITILLWLLKLIYVPLTWVLSAIYRILPKSIKKIIYQFVQIYSTILSKCKAFVDAIYFKRR